MIKRILVLLLSACLIGSAVACGGGAPASEATAPTTAAQTTSALPTVAPTTAAAQTTAAIPCESYLRFCATVQVSGAVTADVTTPASVINMPACATWAAAGPSHHLDVPTAQSFDAQPVVVALTAIGVYTGPGRYELAQSRSGDLPDRFPALSVGGRTFDSDANTTAVVEVAADGSGALTATGLVEMGAADPDARVDLSMRWICQDAQ